MVRLAKSPPELFPDHTPTRPFLRSFNRFTTISPVGELDPRQERDPLTRGFAQPEYPFWRRRRDGWRRG